MTVTTKLLVRPGRHMGEDPVVVKVSEDDFGYGVHIESGVDAINCTIHLRHSEAERMAEFILAEQHVLDVSTQLRKRGRHESPIRRNR